MADPPSPNEVNASLAAVKATMKHAPTKIDGEKVTEVPKAIEKTVEKAVEAPAPIRPAEAMTSSLEATNTSSSAAKEDSKDALATKPDTGTPIHASRAAVVPKTTATATPSTSERAKAVVSMPAPTATSSSAPGTAKSSTSPAIVKPAPVSNDGAPLVAIAPAPQPETPTATTTKPTIVAPQPASTKKRKAPSANSTTACVTGTSTAGSKPSATLMTTRPPVSSPSMADYPVVAQTVKDIFTLLETCTYQTTIHFHVQYSFQFHSRSTIDSHLRTLLPTVDGSLTLAQLEYNLPERPGCNLGDMVELLAATGLLQKEEITDGHPPQQQPPQPQPRYCVNTGLPRTQVTTPTTILQDILEAQDDWRASQKRQAKLHAALKDNNKPPRETLKAILLEFPDICQDPVYVAALRNLHVDVGLVATSFATPTPKKKTKRRKPSTGGGKSKKAATSPKSTTATPAAAAAAATTTTSAPATSKTVSSSAAMPPPRPPAEATKSTATTTTAVTTTVVPAPATTSAPAVATPTTSSS
jgi:hypothetical protein